MSVPQFTDIISLSETEIFNTLLSTETELFNLRFKKATKRSFKSHEIKYAKRRIAQLKTLQTLNQKTKNS
jgi:ribosomal protein L29